MVSGLRASARPRTAPAADEGPDGPPAATTTPTSSAVLDGVTHAYGELTVLSSLSLRLGAGEILAVVGPSGCGKSTLLELVCGLQRPSAGRVTADPAALMPQRDLLLPWASAIDNAALALRVAGASPAAARRDARPLLAAVGLGEFESARPAQLSGGMRQRVAFVRTLLSGKPVLCLDEPLGALDAITRREMQGWLIDVLAREPRSVLMVTHDVEEAVLLADRVVVLSPRPGTVTAQVEVGLPHPRRGTDAAVVALRERTLKALH